MKLTAGEERWLLILAQLPNGWAVCNFAIQDAVFARAARMVRQGAGR